MGIPVGGGNMTIKDVRATISEICAHGDVSENKGSAYHDKALSTAKADGKKESGKDK